MPVGSLEKVWREGRQGTLSPLAQMRVPCLRDAYRDAQGGGEVAALHAKIAAKVEKRPRRERRPTQYPVEEQRPPVSAPAV